MNKNYVHDIQNFNYITATIDLLTVLGTGHMLIQNATSVRIHSRMLSKTTYPKHTTQDEC